MVKAENIKPKNSMNILHYNCVLTFTKNKRGISSVLRYALHWMLP